MKIEMDENTSCFIALVIGLVAIGGCYNTEKTAQAAINAGLVQKGAISHNENVRWDKP
jgi:hypothetical protein